MAGYGFIRASMTCECGCGFDVLDYQLKIEMEDVLFHFQIKQRRVSTL